MDDVRITSVSYSDQRQSLFMFHVANTNQDANMLVEALKSFIPCVHGMPDEDQ